jgi:hypothetical protein
MEGETIQCSKEKVQTMIYNKVYGQLKIEQSEPHHNPGVKSWTLEVLVVPARLVTHVVLL